MESGETKKQGKMIKRDQNNYSMLKFRTGEHNADMASGWEAGLGAGINHGCFLDCNPLETGMHWLSSVGRAAIPQQLSQVRTLLSSRVGPERSHRKFWPEAGFPQMSI